MLLCRLPILQFSGSHCIYLFMKSRFNIPLIFEIIVVEDSGVSPLMKTWLAVETSGVNRQLQT